MQIPKKNVDQEKIKNSLLIFGLLTCWFLAHPYHGLIHDARLYAVQALSHLYPAFFKNDIFIMHGTQDSYTIFSQIYVHAIKFLGLGNSTIVLILIGHTLWICSAYYFAKTILKDKSFWFFLIFLFTLPGYYGSCAIFSYGENFLTPRIYAEALTIFSITFFFQNRYVLAVGFLLMAMIFHPLMAAAGGLFLLFYDQTIKFKIKYYFLLFAISIAFILAYIHIEPFAKLLQIMDDDWFKLVNLRNDYVLIRNWDFFAFNSLFFDISILATACLIVPKGRIYRILLGAIYTGITGLIFSWIGADCFHNVFFIQVQSWRALWLMHWFSYSGLAIIFANYGRLSDICRILCIFYLIAWFGLEYSGGFLALILFVFFWFFYKFKNELKVSSVIKLIVCFVCGISAILWFLNVKEKHIQFFLLSKDLPDFSTINCFYNPDIAPMYTLAFLTFFFCIRKVSGRMICLCTLFPIIFILTTTIIYWDLRPGWKKVRENNCLVTPHPFNKKIPDDALVYAQTCVQDVWFTLGRSSYASRLQGAALLFSREFAIKLEKRLEHLKIVFSKEDIALDYKENYPIKKQNPLSVSDLAHLSNDLELDFVILSRKFPVFMVAEYFDPEREISFYLYDCRLIREKYKYLLLF